MDQNVWLWIAQGVLTVLYGMAGFMKLFRPIEQLKDRINWTAELPRLTRFIGAAELAAAIAMVFPILLDILPWLTPLAAIGLSAIQVLAIGFHIRRGERSIVPFNFVLLALSVFVAVGRWELLLTA